MSEPIYMNQNDSELSYLFNYLCDVEVSDEDFFSEEFSSESLESQLETEKINEETYDRLVAERDQKN